ncbi:LytR/AlgR family response regulator transcription factor [Dokdonella fugitiva]|jgi:two-component system response regulator AlgR|uniref:LytTR family two component transcriptional regulator n=1 Tax=Dokdonella fugitiva TaxID=328517 RepID=A0A4R2IB11_9GAMM|nr:LytTR family DNA-binding domain-containing protein [Dokdonella fugitiva]TCO41387.1 LytTR family two component transcriptional regulator [Dokdonella fugitiva]
MRALVVDDEPLARERMRALLAEIGGVEVVGEAGNGRDALDAVAQLAPDLLLLDIRMPVMDGIEAARHLGSLESPPALIFCTAYGDHALAAFEANAVDYLLKPVRGDRLRAALAKARRWSGEEARGMERALGAGRSTRTHLCARVRGSLVLVPVADVAYLLAEDKYVVVHHAKGEVLIEEPLKALEEEFEDRFVRIHRNCLVARAKLAGLTRTPDGRLFANVEGVTTALEVSRRNLPALRKLIRTL